MLEAATSEEVWAASNEDTVRELLKAAMKELDTLFKGTADEEGAELLEAAGVELDRLFEETAAEEAA